ncbi:MAG TPA: cytochrome c biogenesis protein ResB [Blastocatellia bacterium]|nr:cytochrome c biogenesis protein ResB [Blastocatellia bacterium]
MATTTTEVKRATRESSGETVPSSRRSEASTFDRLMKLLSSVRFGIVMLILLLACCMIGMLIMQNNIEGFREYYASLTPSQRALYESLGFFDIYHSWYFTALLAVMGLNIVLSSIDRFPAAWQYIRKPRLAASPAFIRAQMFNDSRELDGPADVAARQVAARWRREGLRPRVSEDQGRFTVFAQRNAWNRLGAYAVHLALLMILVGGFMTSRYGVGGSMEIIPGESASHFSVWDTSVNSTETRTALLPFEVECTDLQQQLIRPEGGLDVMNTIDWLSFIKIRDKEQGKEVEALVHLNTPFDYRGYRFFQSSFQPRGNARQITVSFESESGERREFTIARRGAVDVEGIGQVSYVNFYPDFAMEHGRPATASAEYANPAAELKIVTADGRVRRTFAFNAHMMEQHPGAAGKPADKTGGEFFLLKDFEKVATSHTMTVQYDPGRTPVYAGFLLLTIALCAVFFFSHQRVWAVIEPAGNILRVHFGGNVNRNRPAFEGRFNSLVNSATEGASNE